MIETLWIVSLCVLLLVIALRVITKTVPLKRVTIFEYQKGLKYTRGRYAETLNAGTYWFFPFFSYIAVVDVRPQFVSIQGQEVLSADGVSLKVSLAAAFEVSDPNIAINKNANFQSSLYLTLQMAAREIMGKEKIDSLVESRAQFGPRLMELASGKATEFGLKLISVDIKDIMIPGEMKKAFAQVVKAQKEGQAALERARSETAALRSLANAAHMMDDNPNLLQIRALQTFADSGGNTLVLGVPNGLTSVLRNNKDTPARRKESGADKSTNE